MSGAAFNNDDNDPHHSTELKHYDERRECLGRERISNGELSNPVDWAGYLSTGDPENTSYATASSETSPITDLSMPQTPREVSGSPLMHVPADVLSLDLLH
ncbi:hypothetical protein BD309DRAFT_656371 [Dichomitus squalens]|nr:hypothetical protein BD309DRAFT_656371 [Dichomitus squalens]